MIHGKNSNLSGNNYYLNIVYSLVSLEWRCLHLNPAPTSGRPTERGVALREVEPHAECQVQNLNFNVKQLPLIHSLIF